MNDTLANAYGTREKLAAARQAPVATEDQFLYAELVKVAAAEGVNLSELSDQDVQEIIDSVKATKTAAAEPAAAAAAADPAAQIDPAAAGGDAEIPKELQEKLAEADFLGRAMAHAMLDELHSFDQEVEKTASPEEQQLAEAIEEMAYYRANEILAAIGEDVGDTVKTAAPYTVNDPAIEETILARAAELLDENGWDVEAIAKDLSAK